MESQRLSGKYVFTVIAQPNQKCENVGNKQRYLTGYMAFSPFHIMCSFWLVDVINIRPLLFTHIA